MGGDVERTLKFAMCSEDNDCVAQPGAIIPSIFSDVGHSVSYRPRSPRSVQRDLIPLVSWPLSSGDNVAIWVVIIRGINIRGIVGHGADRSEFRQSAACAPDALRAAPRRRGASCVAVFIAGIDSHCLRRFHVDDVTFF